MASTANRVFSGSCDCKALQYSCSELPTKIIHDHSRQCQKLSGGPFMTHVVVNAAAFRWEKHLEDPLKAKKMKEYSEYRHDRCFCTTCRSPIYRQWHFKDSEIEIVESSIDHKNKELPTKWPGESETYHIFTDHAVDRMKSGFAIPSEEGKAFGRYLPEVQDKLDDIERKQAKANREKNKSIFKRATKSAFSYRNKNASKLGGG